MTTSASGFSIDGHTQPKRRPGPGLRLRQLAARLLVPVFALLALAVGSVPATQVRLVNIEEMTRRADRIFAGRCTRVESADGVTTVTLEVRRSVKGAAGSVVTIRMPAGDDATGGTAGVPDFQPGEEVVLFLYGESADGLVTPVGLGQGRFRVVTDKHGQRLARNDFANKHLLRGLTPAFESAWSARFESAAPTPDTLSPEQLLDAAAALAVAP